MKLTVQHIPQEDFLCKVLSEFLNTQNFSVVLILKLNIILDSHLLSLSSFKSEKSRSSAALMPLLRSLTAANTPAIVRFSSSFGRKL